MDMRRPHRCVSRWRVSRHHTPVALMCHHRYVTPSILRYEIYYKLAQSKAYGEGRMFGLPPSLPHSFALRSFTPSLRLLGSFTPWLRHSFTLDYLLRSATSGELSLAVTVAVTIAVTVAALRPCSTPGCCSCCCSCSLSATASAPLLKGQRADTDTLPL